MPNTSLAENLDYVGNGAKYDKTAKRIMSFKSVLAWTLKSVCKELSDLDLKYIERNCIGDVSISNKAVHQYHPDRTIELGGDERVTASVGVSFKEGRYSLLRPHVQGQSARKRGDVYLIMNIFNSFIVALRKVFDVTVVYNEIGYSFRISASVKYKTFYS